MDQFRNDITNKMAAIWTRIKFVWANIGRNIFEQQYLSQERKYRTLTHRYGFKRLNKSVQRISDSFPNYTRLMLFHLY